MTETTEFPTLEQIEGLAAQIVAEELTARERLTRLIKAEARIAHKRRPEKFNPAPCRWQDEDGHWDNSYPPDQVYCDRTGPVSYLIRSAETEEFATSRGFYHNWEMKTKVMGLRVAKDGTIYTIDMHGTGRYGSYAAHPGTCSVDVDLEYDRVSPDELDLEDLIEIEADLRSLAFPSSVEKDAESAVETA